MKRHGQGVHRQWGLPVSTLCPSRVPAAAGPARVGSSGEPSISSMLVCPARTCRCASVPTGICASNRYLPAHIPRPRSPLSSAAHGPPARGCRHHSGARRARHKSLPSRWLTPTPPHRGPHGRVVFVRVMARPRAGIPSGNATGGQVESAPPRQQSADPARPRADQQRVDSSGGQDANAPARTTVDESNPATGRVAAR